MRISNNGEWTELYKSLKNWILEILEAQIKEKIKQEVRQCKEGE